MAGKSNIEWTEHTWNPIVGCSVLTPGCTNCYAMKMAGRLEAMAGTCAIDSDDARQHYYGTTKKVNGKTVWTGKLAMAPEHVLTAPLKRKKPTTYFVNSMGDLFHEDAPDDWIDKVFAVMALAPQHTFQVLTKRAERMRAYVSARPQAIWDRRALEIDPSALERLKAIGWPLPNVWLGVSCERQQEADERIPHLLQTPAAVRFISAEPLLGPIDISDYLVESARTNWDWYLDWVIIGGESGHGARPFDIDWARSILQQCRVGAARAFLKQLGSNPYSDERPMHGAPRGKYGDPAAWPPELRVRQMPAGAA
jgi:protein gp37